MCEEQKKPVPRASSDAIRRLSAKPMVSWPVLLILLLALPLAAYLVYAVRVGVMHPLVAALPGAVIGYYVFTPIHEAVHRSASRLEWVNQTISYGSINLLLPYLSPIVLRWGHMQHHRFTNEPGLDPDRLLTSRWYGPVLLWPFFELFYYPQYFRSAEQRPRGEVAKVMLHFIVGIAALSALFYFAGPELFLFWLVASRLGLWLIVFVFVFLPHHPHTVLQKDDFYGATSLRVGYEKLMNVLMAYQNWHIVHHLYPTIPFYRMKAAWLAHEAFHESNSPVRVIGFGLKGERS